MNKYFITFAGITLCTLNAMIFSLGEKAYSRMPRVLPKAVHNLSHTTKTGLKTATPFLLAGTLHKLRTADESIIAPRSAGKCTILQGEKAQTLYYYTEVGSVVYGVGSLIAHFSPKVGNVIQNVGIALPATAATAEIIDSAQKAIAPSFGGYMNANSKAFFLAAGLGVYVVATAAEDYIFDEEK